MENLTEQTEEQRIENQELELKNFFDRKKSENEAKEKLKAEQLASNKHLINKRL